eukprot:5274226-Lingulodinium_polyedra.AAC.1
MVAGSQADEQTAIWWSWPPNQGSFRGLILLGPMLRTKLNSSCLAATELRSMALSGDALSATRLGALWE